MYPCWTLFTSLLAIPCGILVTAQQANPGIPLTSSALIMPEIVLEAPLIVEPFPVVSAAFRAYVSVIINNSGTFISLANLEFLQNNVNVLELAQHTFYRPDNSPNWPETFNLSDFYYTLDPIDLSDKRTGVTWQNGIPPTPGSTYGRAECINQDVKVWNCTRRNCGGCPWDNGWLECEGYMDCGGIETTWKSAEGDVCVQVREARGVLCGNEERHYNSVEVQCKDGCELGRRQFSVWKVALHRMRKMYRRAFL